VRMWVEDGRGGEVKGEKERGREEKEGGWVGGPLWEILNTPLLKVIENYTYHSGTHDFLLTCHRNHRHISHRFQDKRRCPSKIAHKSPIFQPPVFNAPAEGIPLGILYRRRDLKKLESLVFLTVEKVFTYF